MSILIISLIVENNIASNLIHINIQINPHHTLNQILEIFLLVMLRTLIHTNRFQVIQARAQGRNCLIKTQNKILITQSLKHPKETNINSKDTHITKSNNNTTIRWNKEILNKLVDKTNSNSRNSIRQEMLN